MQPTEHCTEKYNLHTHSFYCGHGHGTIAEYVLEAERLGLELLGFSEHCPLEDGAFRSTRMSMEEMSSYERDCRKADSSLIVLTGYECDYLPGYRGYYQQLLESGRADYLISGTHFIPTKEGMRSPFTSELDEDDLKRYRDLVIQAMDTGLFSYIAHPDLLFAGYRKIDDLSLKVSEEIIVHAKELDLPLEVNANGMLKPKVEGRYRYPVAAFWQIAAEQKAPALIGMDAHEVRNLSAKRSEVESFANQFDLDLVLPLLKPGRPEFVRRGPLR